MNLSYKSGSLLQTLTGHRSDVTCCDFAPNFTLITGSSDKTVRLWEWTPGTGFLQRNDSPLLGHKYGVTCVSVSPQGCMLASASIDGTAILWNLHSGRRIHTMVQVNGDAIRVCRFAPDTSVLVTAGDNGAICVWDLVHRSLVRTIFSHEGTTSCLAFTPDCQFLISACSLEILNVWDMQEVLDIIADEQCSPVGCVENVHDLGVLSVDVSPVINLNEDDALMKYYTLVTSGNENEIKMWTIQATMRPKHQNSSPNISIKLNDVINGHSATVTCVRFDCTGTYFASSSLDKVVKMWDATGQCLLSLEAHSRYVNCVAFSRDAIILVSGSNDKCVYVWDLSGNLNLDTELMKPQIENGNTMTVTGDIHEKQVVQYAESDNAEVKLLEKIDDISEGSLNTCSFWGNMLATGSGDKMVRIFKVVDNSLEEMGCSPLEGHTYGVNHVEFSEDGNFLASCSLDGYTCIWNPLTGVKFKSLPKNSLGIKVCRFSPDGSLLVTAGDNEKVSIWDTKTMQELITLSGHLDAVTCADFTPDGKILVTTSANADFLVWSTETYENFHIQDDVHDSGIQSCDFSQNLEPIPNALDKQSYLLATCGNDGLVKLWNISVKTAICKVKLWRTLQGHGGNVFCVRFSPTAGEVVCSTATDRQARIWSVYSGECLFVLDHDSIVTSCAFSGDCSILATGCIDKTLWLWKLPQQLAFQTAVTNKIKCRTKPLVDWSTNDVIRWLKSIEMSEITENVQNTQLDGHKLLTTTEERICCGLGISDEASEKLVQEIRWLKQDELKQQSNVHIVGEQVPDEFFCPITHEIMIEPVVCTDGFTYEKRAIAEWFMSGKFTSPMTNMVLSDLEFKRNSELRGQIHRFLYGDN